MALPWQRSLAGTLTWLNREEGVMPGRERRTNRDPTRMIVARRPRSLAPPTGRKPESKATDAPARKRRKRPPIGTA